jgi:tetratricopeptide (TPR) repeat protein
MKLHPEVEASVEFERARESLAARRTLAALAHLEKALKLQDNPSWYSYLGYCIAKQRGQIKKGIELCLSSLELERDEPVHYLNLGNIYLISGNKPEALRVFREGMARGDQEEIRRILDEIGTRKLPIIKSLPRDHPVNRFLGIILGKIGLR